MAVKKEENIMIRVSSQDKERLTRAAESEGMNLSEWIRWVIRQEAIRIEEREKQHPLAA
jgi:predicted DNA binding CopG/RHH family protein